MAGLHVRHIAIVVSVVSLVMGCTTGGDDDPQPPPSPGAAATEGALESVTAEAKRPRRWVPNVAAWRSTAVGEHMDVVVAYERFLATTEAAVRMASGGMVVSNIGGRALIQHVRLANAVGHDAYKLVGQRSDSPLRVVPKPPRRALVVDCLTDGLHLVDPDVDTVPPPDHVIGKALLEFRRGRWVVIRFNRDETLASGSGGGGPEHLLRQCQRRWSD